ncbi:hypothetical protein N7486_010790, partial [Penicillium sp. IBT 16267x]
HTDPKPRKIKFEDLDIDTDYSLNWPQPEAPPKQQRWTHHGEKPIANMKDVPKGWHEDELDLDPNDLQAQIARCHERIADNIMPFIFEDKLKELEKQKVEKDESMAREPGLSWVIVQRLIELEDAKEFLGTLINNYGQIPNTTAIMAAYRSGKLNLTEGLITYWSNGEQVSQPRPFNWDELFALCDKYNGYEGGFWVEPIKLSVRFPHAPDLHHTMSYLDDTGATHMAMYEDDFERMERGHKINSGVAVKRPPVIGVLSIRGSSGRTRSMLTTVLQVNLFNDKDQQLSTDWDNMAVTVRPESAYARGSHRLSGPWARTKLYSATLPDNTNRVWLFDRMAGFANGTLPIVDWALARPPPLPFGRGLPAAVRPPWVIHPGGAGGAPVPPGGPGGAPGGGA